RLVGREHGKRIVAWSLRDITLTNASLDGLATTVSDDAPAAVPAEAVGHPNGTIGIDHVVVATPNLDRTVDALVAAGLDPRRTRDSDQYGAPMRQVFFRMADIILEVIGTPDRSGEGPAGFFGLALTVADLDAAAERYGDRMGTIKPAVQPGRRIATLRHKELGLSVAIALMSPGSQEYG
ncbi:MAG: VOC family protein, partial [Actinobacteria bacterium]|nr:VOC family protein [Actinomycetota bacterium]